MPNVKIEIEQEDTINKGPENTVYTIDEYDDDGDFSNLIGVFSADVKAKVAKAKAVAKDQEGSQFKIRPWNLEVNPGKIVFVVKADFSAWEEGMDYIAGIFAIEHNAIKCKLKTEKKHKNEDGFQAFVQPWDLDKLETGIVM